VTKRPTDQVERRAGGGHVILFHPCALLHLLAKHLESL
jgi:hypothetical protein